MSTPAEYLHRLLKRLTDECLHGFAHYQLWHLMNEQFRAEPALVDTAPFFFQASSFAHIDSATLRLYRLIDRTKGAVSIYTLIHFAERQPSAFAHASNDDVHSAVERGRALISEADDVLNRFRHQRNGYFVHIAGAYFSNPLRSVVDEHPVTFRDVYDTLTRIGALLNLFRAAHDGSEMLYEVIGVEDSFRSLVSHLRHGLEAKGDIGVKPSRSYPAL